MFAVMIRKKEIKSQQEKTVKGREVIGMIEKRGEEEHGEVAGKIVALLHEKGMILHLVIETLEIEMVVVVVHGGEEEMIERRLGMIERRLGMKVVGGVGPVETLVIGRHPETEIETMVVLGGEMVHLLVTGMIVTGVEVHRHVIEMIVAAVELGAAVVVVIVMTIVEEKVHGAVMTEVVTETVTVVVIEIVTVVVGVVIGYGMMTVMPGEEILRETEVTEMRDHQCETKMTDHLCEIEMIGHPFETEMKGPPCVIEMIEEHGDPSEQVGVKPTETEVAVVPGDEEVMGQTKHHQEGDGEKEVRRLL